MVVRIDEMVTEALPDVSPPAPAPNAATGGGRSSLDLDALDYEIARRRQRQARLWAD